MIGTRLFQTNPQKRKGVRDAQRRPPAAMRDDVFAIRRLGRVGRLHRRLHVRDAALRRHAGRVDGSDDGRGSDDLAALRRLLCRPLLRDGKTPGRPAPHRGDSAVDRRLHDRVRQALHHHAGLRTLLYADPGADELDQLRQHCRLQARFPRDPRVGHVGMDHCRLEHRLPGGRQDKRPIPGGRRPVVALGGLLPLFAAHPASGQDRALDRRRPPAKGSSGCSAIPRSWCSSFAPS